MENTIIIEDSIDFPDTSVDKQKDVISNLGRFNTWYLNKHFTVQTQPKLSDTFTVKCIPCLPEVKILTASTQCTSNLFKHINKKHPSFLKAAQKRKLSDAESNLSTNTSSSSSSASSALTKTKYKQPSLTSFGSRSVVSQDTVNQLVVKFVIDTVQPLRVVEEPSFVNLVKGLQNNRTVLSPSCLRTQIHDRFSTMRTVLIERLNNVEYVSTTADIWSSARRSYLGMTIHWVNSTSLTRVSAAIALVRLHGTHDYKAIGKNIHEIHSFYQIQNKVLF